MSNNHVRCIDPDCGWQGQEMDLGEKVDVTTWKFTAPHADTVQCCPRCEGDFTDGLWCETCKREPAIEGCEDCAKCWAIEEAKQDAIVHEFQRTARELHGLSRDAELRNVLLDIMGTIA